MIRAIRGWRGVVAIVAVCSSCIGQDSSQLPGAESTTGDGTGVEIVNNPAELPTTLWTVSESPVIDIGSSENGPQHELFQVRGAQRLSDGRLVIADADSRELRFYDEQGKYLMSAGGKGEGPGEFLWIDSLFVLPGDSAVVLERGRGNLLSVFDEQGDFHRSFRLRTDEFFAVAGLFETGEVLAAKDLLYSLTAGEVPPAGGPAGEPLTLVKFSPSGEPISRIVQFPRFIELVYSGNGLNVGIPAPFSPDASWSVEGGWLAAGYSDRYEIGLYRPDGRLVRLIRREVSPTRVTRSAIDAHWGQYEQWTRPEVRRVIAELLDDAGVPEHLPAFSRIILDDELFVWVEDYRIPGADGSWWTVHDPEGRAIARAETPADLQITQITRNVVVGKSIDHLDTEHVKVYDLDRKLSP